VSTSVGGVVGRLAQWRIRAVAVRPARVSRSAGSAVTTTALSWLTAWVRDLTADARASLNMRSISTAASAVLAVVVAVADSTAWAAACASTASVLPWRRRATRVRAVDLDHGDALAAQVSGHSGAVGAGAVHPGAVQRAEAAGPPQQFAVAGGGGRHLGVSHQHTHSGDHRRDVDVFMGVHTQDHLPVRCEAVAAPGGFRHAGHWLFVS